MIMVSDFILATLNLICLSFVMLSYSNLIHPTVHIDGLLILLSVFDVDIGDGEPIRKLPYNRSGRFLLLPFECLLCVLVAMCSLRVFVSLAPGSRRE